MIRRREGRGGACVGAGLFRKDRGAARTCGGASGECCAAAVWMRGGASRAAHQLRNSTAARPRRGRGALAARVTRAPAGISATQVQPRNVQAELSRVPKWMSCAISTLRGGGARAARAGLLGALGLLLRWPRFARAECVNRYVQACAFRARPASKLVAENETGASTHARAHRGRAFEGAPSFLPASTSRRQDSGWGTYLVTR